MREPSALCLKVHKSATDPDLEKKLTDARERSQKLPPGHLLLKVLEKRIPERQSLAWSESRHCVLSVIDQLFGDQVIPNNFALSLAHTRDASIAVGAICGPQRNIGVDLELSTRSISDAAAQRFMSIDERKLIPAPLEAWVIKEASFKANLDNAETLLPQYLIQTYDLHREGLVKFAAKPDLSFKFRAIHYQQWTIAFAQCA